MILSTPNLTGYWPGFTDRGNGVILDRGPSARLHLEAVDTARIRRSTPLVATQFGRVPAMDWIDTSNRRYACNDSTQLRTESGAGWSWECVIRHTTSSLEVVFIKGPGGGGNVRMYFLVNTDHHMWRWDAFDSGYAMSTTRPTHIVYRFLPTTSTTSGTEEFWANGRRVGQRVGAVPADDTSSSLIIAGLGGGTVLPFTGRISHVALYRRALREPEIVQHAIASGLYGLP